MLHHPLEMHVLSKIVSDNGIISFDLFYLIILSYVKFNKRLKVALKLATHFLIFLVIIVLNEK
ncbi:hypothetical protein LH53_09730 [Mesotoga sp. TolDC]|nr:hypothetical protein LH53_09730 [Mesotoga sp. TolDC]